MSRLIDRLNAKRATPVSMGTAVFFSETFPTKDGTEGALESFQSYVRDAYQSNGIVFAAVTARQMLLSEARFKWRNFSTKDTFGTPALTLLEKPYPGGTTGKVISRFEQDASLAGNSYLWKMRSGRLRRLPPNEMRIVTFPKGHESEGLVVGYVWQPAGERETFIPAREIAHYAPIPDPMAEYRGMSWVTPIAMEVLSDKEMTRHKHKFFTNAATPAMIVKHEKKFHNDTKTAIRRELAATYEGTENAFKSLIIDGGADIQVVGSKLGELDFSGVQGGGENRIAVASGVPAVVLGIKEGLGGSSLNAGNYGESMRRFSDITCRPLWREMAAVLEPFVGPAPQGAELWYDTSDIAALRQDEDKQAEIEQKKAGTIRTLVDGGFTPESVVQAVTSGDFTDLEHTGLPSVQVQEGDPEGGDEEPEEVEEDGAEDESENEENAS